MIPLPDAVAEVVKDKLKEKFPGFGLWLYATNVAGLVAMLIAAPFAFAPFLIIVFGVTTFLFRRYLRKFGDRAPSRDTIAIASMTGAIVGVILGVFLLAAFADVSRESGYSGQDPTVVASDPLEYDANGQVVMNATDLEMKTDDLNAMWAEENDAEDTYCSLEDFEKRGCETEANGSSDD